MRPVSRRPTSVYWLCPFARRNVAMVPRRHRLHHPSRSHSGNLGCCSFLHRGPGSPPGPVQCTDCGGWGQSSPGSCGCGWGLPMMARVSNRVNATPCVDQQGPVVKRGVGSVSPLGLPPPLMDVGEIVVLANIIPRCTIFPTQSDFPGFPPICSPPQGQNDHFKGKSSPVQSASGWSTVCLSTRLLKDLCVASKG